MGVTAEATETRTRALCATFTDILTDVPGKKYFSLDLPMSKGTLQPTLLPSLRVWECSPIPADALERWWVKHVGAVGDRINMCASAAVGESLLQGNKGAQLQDRLLWLYPAVSHRCSPYIQHPQAEQQHGMPDSQCGSGLNTSFPRCLLQHNWISVTGWENSAEGQDEPKGNSSSSVCLKRKKAGNSGRPPRLHKPPQDCSSFFSLL